VVCRLIHHGQRAALETDCHAEGVVLQQPHVFLLADLHVLGSDARCRKQQAKRHREPGLQRVKRIHVAPPPWGVVASRPYAPCLRVWIGFFPGKAGVKMSCRVSPIAWAISTQ